LGYVYLGFGQYEQALAEFRDAQRLSGESSQDYANLAYAYLYLNRFDDARTTAQEALRRKLDSPDLRIALYSIAFHKMRLQVWSSSHPTRWISPYLRAGFLQQKLIQLLTAESL